MGINTSVLKKKINEKSMSVDQVAKEIGIDRATFYRKMKSGGVKFTVAEVQRIIDVLHLSEEEAIMIFFVKEVA